MLANLTPLEIDQSLEAWLPPSIRCRVETRGRVGDYGWEVEGYGLKDGFDESDGRESLRLLEMLNARAEPEACQRILARLKVLTRERNLSQEDLVVQIAIYAEELSEYPLDVVRDVCRWWPKYNKWFPSWAELREACEDRAMKRRGLLLALKRYFDAQGRDARKE